MMTLDAFVFGLRRYGVTVPHWDEFTALRRAGGLLEPRPAKPLLKHTPDELTAYIRARALHKVAAHPRIGDAAEVARGVQAELGAELVALLADHVDEFILGLRPAFDEAAAAARRVVDLGVSPAATAETLFDAPEDARRAWREFTRTHAGTLDSILNLRMAMSEILGAPPATRDRTSIALPNHQISWGLVISRRGGGILPASDTSAPHRRWLQFARALYLPTVAELDPAAIAEAEGLPVERLLAEAHRRAAAGLAIDETTDSPTARVDLSGAYLSRYGNTEAAES